MQVGAFLDAVPLPALLVRPDERIEAANEGARALFGQAIAGRHFITALRQPMLLDAVESCLRGAGARDTQYLTNDGERDVTYRATVRPAPIGADSGALVCLADETDLLQAGAMRRDFVADLSHELRSPLAVIKEYAELLADGSAGPVNDILQMHEDPQAIAREMIIDVDHATAGTVKSIGHPVKFSRTPAKIDRAAPVLGQHSREVLSEIGYPPERIEALIQSKAVIAACPSSNEVVRLS